MRPLIQVPILWAPLLLPSVVYARTRWSFGVFYIQAPCRNSLDAESIRNSAEDCLQSVSCDALFVQPDYVGLGNPTCLDNHTVSITGGVMDFDDDFTAPTTQEAVDMCVQSTLQHDDCLVFFSPFLDALVLGRTFPGTPTSNNNSSETKSSNNTVVVGAGAAGAVLLLGLFSVILLVRRRPKSYDKLASKQAILPIATATSSTDDSTVAPLASADSLHPSNNDNNKHATTTTTSKGTSNHGALGHYLDQQPATATEDDTTHTPTTATKNSSQNDDNDLETQFTDDDTSDHNKTNDNRTGYDVRPVQANDDDAVILVPLAPEKVWIHPALLAGHQQFARDENSHYFSCVESPSSDDDQPFLDASREGGESETGGALPSNVVLDTEEVGVATNVPHGTTVPPSTFDVDDNKNIHQLLRDSTTNETSSLCDMGLEITDTEFVERKSIPVQPNGDSLNDPFSPTIVESLDNSIRRNDSQDNNNIVDNSNDDMDSFLDVDDDKDADFEPDRYWDPDDTSVTSLDQNGETSFFLSPLKESLSPPRSFSVSLPKQNVPAPTLNSHQTESESWPRRKLLDWLRAVPPMCRTSCSSLPSLVLGDNNGAHAELGSPIPQRRHSDNDFDVLAWIDAKENEDETDRSVASEEPLVTPPPRTRALSASRATIVTPITARRRALSSSFPSPERGNLPPRPQTFATPPRQRANSFSSTSLLLKMVPNTTTKRRASSPRVM